MRNRCNSETNPQYRHYGARGIYVCARWDDFDLFLKDMGPRPSPKHTIDRIDNDGPYAPYNCRWATPSQQNRNSRRTVELRKPLQIDECMLNRVQEIMGANQHTPMIAAAYRRELVPMPLRIAQSQQLRLIATRDRSGISVQEHIRRAIDLYLAVTEKEALELGLMVPPTATSIQPIQRVVKR